MLLGRFFTKLTPDFRKLATLEDKWWKWKECREWVLEPPGEVAGECCWQLLAFKLGG